MTQRELILLTALWQFIFMVDFVAPLPLGPTLSREMGFAAPLVSWLSIAYTLASLVSGIIAATVVDKLGRKPTIYLGMALFAIANVATPWATTLAELAACRVLAGMAGAPVVATLMAMVIDAAPPNQRGKALSMVMSGASLAVIAGVPLALALANEHGWQSVFWALGACSIGLLACCWSMSPRLGASMSAQGHASIIENPQDWMPHRLLSSPGVRRAYGLQALSQFATFLLIPVLSTYLITNLQFSTGDLPALYATGGLSAFACMHIAGRASDKWGPSAPLKWACVGLVGAMLAFIWPSATSQPRVIQVAFVVFMAANAAKNVALSSYTAGLAPPDQRAAFMNLQGSVQDMGILLSGLGSLLLLSQSSETGRMSGMGTLVAVASVLILLLAFGLCKSHLQNTKT